MLTIQKVERINVDDALRNQWLVDHTKSYLNINKKIALDGFNNMKNLFFGY